MKTKSYNLVEAKDRLPKENGSYIIMVPKADVTEKIAYYYNGKFRLSCSQALIIAENVVWFEEVKSTETLSCSTCKYYKPDINKMCSSCFARDRHTLIT